MPLSVAYTSAGKLYLKEGDRPASEVVSRFGQGVISRALKQGERDGWKFQRKGGVVYTSGSAVYLLDADGARRRLEKGSLIDQGVFLEETT